MKLKRESVAIVSLTIALLLGAFGIQSMMVMALPTRTVGVQVGNWAEYNVFVDGNATYLNKINIPVSDRFTVATISGTNITCQGFETFKNLTQRAITGSIDVESGSGNMSGFIIAANLNPGDTVYNGSWGGFTGSIINETTTRNYLGSNVEVCHMNRTSKTISPGRGSWGQMNAGTCGSP